MNGLFLNYNGIKTLLAYDKGLPDIPTRVSCLAQPYMIGLQGRNEPDSFTELTWNGLTENRDQLDFSATRAYQYDLYNAAKANPAAKLKPIVSPSFNWSKNTASLAPLPFDKIAQHMYPSNGTFPGWWALTVERLPDSAKMVASGQSPQPIWVTETGYHVAYTLSDARDGAITTAALGKYVPRLFATNFNQKIERTFIYDFYDDGADPLNNEQNFGLIKNAAYGYAEKPSYWGIKNLIALLKDPGAPFSPGALNYSLNVSNPNIKTTLLQKRNGEYYLLLWQEVSSCTSGQQARPTWDPPRPLIIPADIQVSSIPVTVSFGTQAETVTTYKEFDNPTIVTSATLTNKTSVQVDVPDEIVVVKIKLPAGMSPNSNSPAPASGPDLVINKVWSSPANPVAGEPTTLHVTVKNTGNVATTASTSVAFAIDKNPPSFAVTNDPLAAGESRTIATAGLTGLAAGFHTFRIDSDYYKTVAETNELNNMRTLTVPVLTDRFISNCDATSPDWVPSNSNWTVGTSGGSGGRIFLKNTTQTASGTLTRLIPATSKNWRLDFEYNWLYGNASHSLKVYADILNDSGNGYRILVHQGGYINYQTPSILSKQIELFKVTNGMPATAPMATGAGYHEGGDPTSLDFKPIAFIYDHVTQSISAYADLNGDTVLEQVIAPVRDTVTPLTQSFTKVVLGASDGQSAGATGATPMFDNVRFGHGMTTLVPASHFIDTFKDGLAHWTSASDWAPITSASGEKYIHNPSTTSSGTMTHLFVAPLTNGWSLGFDYDFQWGGNATYGTGASNLAVHASMLDDNNNGYRIYVYQGDGGTAANNNKVIKIYKVSVGAEDPEPLAQGIGYNILGWNSFGNPRFKRVTFSYNRTMQTLSAFIDLNSDGVMEEVIAPIQNTSFTSFTKLQLGVKNGQGSAVKPAFDNIEVGLIQ